MSFFDLSPLDEEVVRKKEKYLPLLISSIENEEPKQIAEAAKYVCDFISVYDITVVNKELLVLVIPAIKNSLDKCFEDNILIVTTTDDMGMQDMLKDSLNTSVLLLDIFKNILEYFTKQEDILVTHILSLPIHITTSLLNTFKHCKEGQDIYKNNLNAELLELFKIAQDVHAMLLKTLENCIFEKENEENLIEITNILDNLSNMGEILSDINLKCMADNWKGYMTIIQKITSVLNSDLTPHLVRNFICLEKIISQNLSTFKENIDCDKKTAGQSLKVAIFLIKLVIKICNTFWTCLEKLINPIIDLCLTIYSGYNGTKENSELYAIEILDLYKPFLQNLCNETYFLHTIQNYNINSKNSFLVLNMLNNVFDVLKTCQCETDMEYLLLKLFETVKLSYSEMTFGINVYDFSLVNVSVCLLIFKCTNLETILLKNILQTNVWCNILATDIWCLLLSHSESNTVFETLLKVIKIRENADFGIFTGRIEQLNLDNLIKRIYTILPTECHKMVANQYPPNDNIALWNILGYQNMAKWEKSALLQSTSERGFSKTKINRMENFQIFYTSLQYLEASNVMADGGLAVNSINDLWSFQKPSEDILSNNVFKVYVTAIGKITIKNMETLPKSLIMAILDHLLVLGTENQFKLLISDIMLELCLNYQEEFGPEQHKLCRHLSGLIYPVILKNCDVAIKIKIYNLISKLNDIPAYKNVVKIVFQNAVNLQNEMGNYIKENYQLCLDPNYLHSIRNVKINHKCVVWKKGNINGIFKEDDSVVAKSVASTKFAHDFEEETEKEEQHKSLGCKITKIKNIENIELPPAKKSKFDNEDTACDVTEALSSIKSEIKNLMKILKTEKISPKNASQIKIIISQLQSLL